MQTRVKYKKKGISNLFFQHYHENGLIFTRSLFHPSNSTIIQRKTMKNEIQFNFNLIIRFHCIIIIFLAQFFMHKMWKCAIWVIDLQFFQLKIFFELVASNGHFIFEMSQGKEKGSSKKYSCASASQNFKIN